jgi:hypothetical protein
MGLHRHCTICAIHIWVLTHKSLFPRWRLQSTERLMQRLGESSRCYEEVATNPKKGDEDSCSTATKRMSKWHSTSMNIHCLLIASNIEKNQKTVAIRDKHEPINLSAWVTYCRDLSHQRRTAWLLSYGVNCTMKMEWKMRKYRFEAKKLLVGQGYHLWQDKTHVKCAFTTFQQILT